MSARCGAWPTAPTAGFSLRAALGDTLRTLAIRAHKKRLELVSHVQSDVPDALVGDAGRLRQVLLNLVGNAIKFTEQGEVVVRVSRIADRGAGRSSLLQRRHDPLQTVSVQLHYGGDHLLSELSSVDV